MINKAYNLKRYPDFHESIRYHIHIGKKANS
jgi:hypothetical protein